MAKTTIALILLVVSVYGQKSGSKPVAPIVKVCEGRTWNVVQNLPVNGKCREGEKTVEGKGGVVEYCLRPSQLMAVPCNVGATVPQPKGKK